VEWFVLALAVLALILAATSIKMAPQGVGALAGVGQLVRTAHDQAEARSPERKA
jgi:hypothetical protein